MKTNSTRLLPLLIRCAAAAAVLVQFSHAETVLTSGSFATSSGAGGTGAASTNCMIMSDGTSWSGGAVGVQGSDTTGVGNITPLAANVTFKFNVGSFIDSLKTTYGNGWTITNPTLTLQYTLYANNSRFGGGAGTFDIYWVGKDTWVQGTSNPVYATNETTLSTWSSAYSNLGEQNYTWSTPGYTGTESDVTNSSVWVTDKTGVRQSTITLNLDLTTDFLADILNASASSNSDVSLYLMSTSDTMGMTIFTGGASTLPTLKFDVVAATPEPSTWALLISSLALLFYFKRRTKLDFRSANS